ncbi:ethionine resistance protein [Mycoemilia scoparia]|uniref:Ethionine resistance protein n=1 Tax=Mycoemilia scoparia TaxID=417184 RepID=A0A9W7ZXU6_9FUNG|nr:ethionine resistance protein [Mycoemilia scoparia]
MTNLLFLSPSSSNSSGLSMYSEDHDIPPNLHHSVSNSQRSDDSRTTKQEAEAVKGSSFKGGGYSPFAPERDAFSPHIPFENSRLLLERTEIYTPDDRSLELGSHKKSGVFLLWWNEFWYLVNKTLPIMAGGILQSMMPFIEVISLGHLGKSELAGMGLAHILIVFSGYPLLFGVIGALETLGSQAFMGAAKHPFLTGIYLQRSILIGSVGFAILSLLWLNAQWALSLLQNDQAVLGFSSLYLRAYFSSFYILFLLDCVKQYLYAQGITYPIPFVQLIGCLATILGQWILVWNQSTSLGFVGIPISMGLGYLAMLASLCLYIYKTDAKRCWNGWSLLSLKGWDQVMQLAIPGSLMTLGSSGANELVSIGAAGLGTTSLAAQSILTTTLRIAIIPNSYIGIVASNRVGNLLGSQQAYQARMSAIAAQSATCIVALFGLFALTTFRVQWAAFFTNEPDVLATAVSLLPLVSVTMGCETFSTCLSGLLRGQGRQPLAACIKLTSFYLLAAPIGYYTCFKFDQGLSGLWIGLLCGHGLTAIAEGICIALTNWAHQVDNCKRRLNSSSNAGYGTISQPSTPPRALAESIAPIP